MKKNVVHRFALLSILFIYNHNFCSGLPLTNGGFYQILLPHTFGRSEDSKDTAYIKCQLYYVSMGVLKKAFKNHEVVVNNEAYKTDSDGIVLIKVLDGSYKVTAKPAPRLSSNKIEIKKYHFRKNRFYNVYFYFVY